MSIDGSFDTVHGSSEAFLLERAFQRIQAMPHGQDIPDIVLADQQRRRTLSFSHDFNAEFLSSTCAS
jgi:hypothetical protein